MSPVNIFQGQQRTISAVYTDTLRITSRKEGYQDRVSQSIVRRRESMAACAVSAAAGKRTTSFFQTTVDTPKVSGKDVQQRSGHVNTFMP